VNRVCRRAVAVLALSVAVGVASGADVTFVQKPVLTAAGDGVRIDFAVSAPTDVEVAVLEQSGKVVRHLVAGVVGASEAVPPLKAGALRQSILWDRTDDAGQPVAGPCTVRVRIGTQAVLGNVIDRREQVMDKVYSLATDDAGRLYVASGGIYSSTPVFSIKVFDRAGTYVRTILPFPANLTPEQAAGFGKGTARDGHLTPGNFNPLVPYVHKGGIVTFLGNRVRDGAIWLLNTDGRICRIGTDGRCIVWSKGVRTVRPMGGPMCWALAPDGKTLYLTGIWDTRKRAKPSPWRDGVIFRVDPATGEAKAFVEIDAPADSFWLKERNGWYHFKNWGRKNGLAALHGMAVDREGRLYVCDRVNQRLAVYSPEGTLLGSTAVEWPDLLALSPGDDTIYVSTRKVIDGYKAKNEFKVLKLSGWKDGRVVAELTLQGDNAPSMAVDATAKPAVIWLSNLRGGGVARIEDRGSELVLTGRLNAGVPRLPGIVKLWADPETDDVYVNNGWSGLSKFNGLTGQGGAIPITAIDLAIGPDRNLYLFGRKGWNEPIYRCDLNFKPVPFSGTGKPTTGPPPGEKGHVYGRYGMGWSNKGISVTRDGRIYVRHMYDWAKYFVTVFGPDGMAEPHDRVAGGIVGPVDADAGGLGVGREGHIYLGMHGHPRGLPAARPNEGCVVKFRPSGGGRVPRPKEGEPKPPYLDWGRTVVEGAERAYPYLAPMAYKGCVCKEARFDLDGFGRLYIPNVLDFCVRVVDNVGNVVVPFGYYGNADSRGADSAVPKPAIPLGWPLTCSVNQHGRVYISDVLNQRIVRVDLKPTAKATCPVPGRD